MVYMFDQWISLKELNLQTFNTSEVNNKEKMFCDCSTLEQIKLSSFNTNKEIVLSACLRIALL